jgi:transposase
LSHKKASSRDLVLSKPLAMVDGDAVAAPRAPRLQVRRQLRKQLERLTRSRKAPHALVERAKIIVLAEQGQSNYAIARKLGITEVTVRKWRDRFGIRPKLSTLRDAPRSGRPPHFTPEQRAEVVRVACERPQDCKAPFRDVWTYSSLQQTVEREMGETISRSEIWRILQCHGVRPHRVVGWLHSSDPEFRPKVEAICNLYVNPPKNATILCVDEKTGIQALEPNHPLRQANRQRAGRSEFEYTRNGTVTLIGAFDIKTGEVYGSCARRTGKNLIKFLETLAKKYPTGPVYIIWDNLNVHTGERWELFNKRHGGRFHFVYTPKHASWVNQIELWFSILQRRVIRHGSFRSEGQLTYALRGFIAHWNMVEAHPFRWRFRGVFREVLIPALAA